MSSLPFIGRKEGLTSLHDLTRKKTSSLVALRGRRRIGKSRLIEEFARQRKNCRFLPFSGLVPSSTTTADTEKEEFSRQMSMNLGLHQIKADDWGNMFSYLAKETKKKGKVVILFDEISWMGSKDPTFLGKLKNAWDLEFKKNPELIGVLSVNSRFFQRQL
jgi:AAA+ ATPase superfamily predicted ATPase